jgi:hypothetical protein
MDERLVAEVLEVLKPIHRFNFTRGLPEHRDPILGSSTNLSQELPPSGGLEIRRGQSKLGG